ncbi:hypothetical protein SPRG_14907 [Saprolegnia parasitica CBS 223.65]|uniref:Uncharacterized protein n=1 Tax=Saprolegnia parasitica (strain CBS 223.65) TaxID=695850 RepID=A0A067BZZ2_SAPPC|nr:hypothetical protein SPRG_14907 [Saprolegnia parasitica CBS 223.65]KDO19876.1 hypothetical protein SPRG_14907 [Saprolegnia parasitica CBS 223.65]|eukprot:XP_012209433.1 hypothetical protein SPRG_14907 [Saprolegnia parasitica CBS 223.65]
MSYRDEYPVGSDDDDEVCSLLNNPRRRAPLHMNSYLSQIEQHQRARLQRWRRLKILFAAIIAVATLTTLSLQYSTTWQPDAPPSFVAARAASICDSTQCIDIVPRTKLLPAVCPALDRDHIHVVADYVVGRLYLETWPGDANFTCSQPRVTNATMRYEDEITAPLAACPMDVTVTGALTPTSLSRTVSTRLYFIDHATYRTPGLAVVVSDGWDGQSIQGLPGVVLNDHAEGIWLGLAVPSGVNVTQIHMHITDAEGRRDLLEVVVTLPPTTALAGIRLDRDGRAWPPGRYHVDAANLFATSFLVLSTSSRAIAPLDDVIKPPAVFNGTAVAAACQDRVNDYCACQAATAQDEP